MLAKKSDRKREERKAYLAIIAMMFIIGFSFLFVKIALYHADTFEVLAHRFTFAFIAASILVIFSKIKLAITRKGWLVILPLALLYPLLFFTFQTVGLENTTSSEAGIIFATTPIFVAIFASLILKEQTTLWQKIFILLSVSGVIYITLMRTQALDASFTLFSLKGVIYILLSALSTGLNTVLIRKYRAEFSNFTFMYLTMVIGFVVFNSIIVATAVLNHDYRLITHYIDSLANKEYLFVVFYLGVLSTAVTQFLSIFAVARIEAARVGVFNNLSAIITIIAGVLFLNETLYYYHIIGALIILVGIIGSNIPSKKFPKSLKRDNKKSPQVR